MSIQVVREVTADVIKRGATRAVYAKQYDYNSRFLNIRIQEEGKDIVIDSTLNAEVILNVERPDKQENMFKGTVNEDGTVKVPLTSWMLELEGTLICDVSVVREGEAKLTTMSFNIYVEAAVVTDEAIVETEEYSVIVDLLARTSDAAETAARAAQDAVIVKEKCEEATQRANEAAEEAEDLVDGHIHRIVEKNKGVAITLWVGTTEEFEALESKENNCFYIKTDETKQPKVLWEGQIADTTEFVVPGINKYRFFEIWLEDSLNAGSYTRVLAYKSTYNIAGHYFIKGSVVESVRTSAVGLDVVDSTGIVRIQYIEGWTNFDNTKEKDLYLAKIIGIM